MAKVVKLKDRHANPILPLTRSTAVEMNEGISVEEKFKNIENSQKLSFYTTGTCSVNIYTKDDSLEGDYSEQTPVRTIEYSANTLVSLDIADNKHFEIVNPNDCINIIYSWPGACEKFYDWFMNVDMFCNMIFNFNKMDHTQWEHSTSDGSKYKYGVKEAQYRNCIFWWDAAMTNVNVHCYTLHKTQECPLFYSTIPENTYKTLCEPYNITNNPNFTNEVFLNSMAVSSCRSALSYSHTRSVPFGCWEDAGVITNIIKINGDCRTFLAWSSSEDTAVFDCETVTNFGYRLSGDSMYWNAFYECRNLKNLMLKNLKISVNLSWSPISQYSLNYIINNAANTSAITIALSSYTWYNLSDSIKTTAESKNINLILDKSHYSDMQDMKIWDDVEGIKNSYLSVDNLDLTSYVSKTELNAAGYITSFTETDPTIPSYVKGITETDITNWNNKADKKLVVALNITGEEDTSYGHRIYVEFEDDDIDINDMIAAKENIILKMNDSYYECIHYSVSYRDLPAHYWQFSNGTGSYIELSYDIQVNARWYIKDLRANWLTQYDDESSYILNKPTKLSDFINDAGYITSFTETDPTVPSYVKEITETDITNWNNKADDALLVTLTGLSQQSDEGDIDSSDGVYFTTNKTQSEINSASTVNVLVPAEIASQFGFGSSNIIVYPDTSDTYQFFISDTLVNGCFWGTDGGYARFYVENFRSFIRTGTLNSTIDLYGDDVTNEQISNGRWDSQIPSIGVTYLGIQTLDHRIHHELNDAAYISSSSLNTTLSSYATSANYDSNTKKIYLKNGTTTLSEIDATDFIKDGMVDTAYVQGTNLVISFNTDAGKEAVNVPITDIFNANNYYTKSEIDNELTSYVKTEIQSAVFYNERYKVINDNINGIILSTYNNDGNSIGTWDGAIAFNDIGSRIKSTPNGIEIDDYNSDTRYTFVKDKRGDVAITKDITNAINSYVISASYLQSFTETDPTVPNYVKSITEQNITNWNTAHTNSHTHSNKTVIDNITSTNIDNWNSKTSNIGTITGITMNGTSKGTSGVVDLGTVITSHQSLENYVTKSELNSASYISSFTETDPTVPTHVKSITQQNITDWNNKLSSETQLSKGTTTGSGNAVTDISVSNHQITLTKGATFLTEHQSLANYVTYDYIGSLDDLTTAELNTIFN